MADDHLPSLRDIKAAHPGALMIPVADAAPFVARTRVAAAKLAQRGGFPVPPKKVGGKWMVNVRKLAEFIDGADDQPAPVAQPLAKAAKPRASSARDETAKTVRQPSMSKVLLAMRGRMELTRAQLDFEQALFAELEAIAVREAAGEPMETRRARSI